VGLVAGKSKREQSPYFSGCDNVIYGTWSMACTLVTIFIAGRFCSVLELSIKPVWGLRGSFSNSYKYAQASFTRVKNNQDYVCNNQICVCAGLYNLVGK
jgi:hypothetical protein